MTLEVHVLVGHEDVRSCAHEPMHAVAHIFFVARAVVVDVDERLATLCGVSVQDGDDDRLVPRAFFHSVDEITNRVRGFETDRRIFVDHHLADPLGLSVLRRGCFSAGEDDCRGGAFSFHHYLLRCPFLFLQRNNPATKNPVSNPSAEPSLLSI